VNSGPAILDAPREPVQYLFETYRAESGRPIEVTMGTLLPAAFAWLNFTTGTGRPCGGEPRHRGEEFRLATLDRLLTHPLSRHALKALAKATWGLTRAMLLADTEKWLWHEVGDSAAPAA
jgi:hypothetical protein